MSPVRGSSGLQTVLVCAELSLIFLHPSWSVNSGTGHHIPAAPVPNAEATSLNDLLLSDKLGSMFKNSIDPEDPNIILLFHYNWLSVSEL